MEDFVSRKPSDEHGFFIVVTSLNKNGEGKIRDLTGDVLFPMTFKCPMQRLSKDKILEEAMTQFFIHIELNSTSL